MTEVLDNAINQGTQTHLSAAVASGDTTINVADVASSTLQNGNFRIMVIDPTNDNSEIMLVTGGQATTLWTVQRAQEGTTAHSFPQYSIVRHVITAEGLAALQGPNGTPPSPDWILRAWTLAQAFRIVSANRDSNGAITTASIIWPDGATGTFTTDTASTVFPGAIDAYHITYVYGAGPTTKTITQPAVTRNPSTGAVDAQPALTVA